MNYRLSYILLTFACICLFAVGVGRVPLLGLDESLYAEVSRAMAASHDYIVPYYNGLPFYDKPPLIYWLQALSIHALGVNSLAARLPSVIMAFLLTAVVFRLADLLFGRRAAVYSGFCLAICLLTVGLARMAIIDMTFALLLTLTLGTFILAYCRISSRNGYLFSWVFLGLAVMTKGPVGAVLAGVPILAFLAFRRDLKSLKSMFIVRGLIITLLICLPWYLAANSATGGAFLREFIFHQNIARAMGKDFQHNGNLFYYIPVFLAGFLPWSIFIPAAIRGSLDEHTEKVRIAGQFIIIWILTIFLMFSLIVSKLPGYIYPIYPAAAMLVGVWWSRRGNRNLIWSTFACGVFLLLLAAALVVMSGKADFADSALRIVSFAMATVLAAGAILSMIFAQQRKKAHVFAALATSYSLFLLIVVLAGLPVFSRQTDGAAVPIAEFVNDRFPTADVVAYDHNQKQANMPNLPFYLHRPVLFAWNPDLLQSELKRPGQAIVITEAVTPAEYLTGLEEVHSFGKYVVYLEKTPGE